MSADTDEGWRQDVGVPWSFLVASKKGSKGGRKTWLGADAAESGASEARTFAFPFVSALRERNSPMCLSA